MNEINATSFCEIHTFKKSKKKFLTALCNDNIGHVFFVKKKKVENKPICGQSVHAIRHTVDEDPCCETCSQLLQEVE